MSIFGNIMSGIFSHGSPKVQPTSTVSVAPSPTSASSSTAAATRGRRRLRWTLRPFCPSLRARTRRRRKSIVDLMKLLNLDISLSARKELAKELHYTADTENSAAMNIWLHKQVMIKLAENGGKVSDALKA